MQKIKFSYLIPFQSTKDTIIPFFFIIFLVKHFIICRRYHNCLCSFNIRIPISNLVGMQNVLTINEKITMLKWVLYQSACCLTSLWLVYMQKIDKKAAPITNKNQKTKKTTTKKMKINTQTKKQQQKTKIKGNINQQIDRGIWLPF